MSRAAIPLADAPALRGLAHRTAIVRWTLALALAAVGVAALVSAHGLQVGEGAFIAPGAAGVVVLDLSSSTEAAPPDQIELALRRIAVSGRKAGLVLFSDVAYEALPPNAKAIELKPYLRYFSAPRIDPTRPFDFMRERTTPASPWAGFRAGTRISAGLRVAERAVARSSRRSVVLISDLNDSLFDLPQLTRVLNDYAQSGIRLRVVGLNPSVEDLAFWQRQLGKAAFVPDEQLRAPATVQRQQLVGDFPTALVVLGAVLALLLASNELWSARLSWMPEQ